MGILEPRPRRPQPGNGCPEYALQVFPPALKVIIVALGGLIVPYAAFVYNKGGAAREAKRRGDAIEKYLLTPPPTPLHVGRQRHTGQNFQVLAMNKDIYGDVADGTAMIYYDITLLGYDLITAMKMSVDRAASVWLTEFSKAWSGPSRPVANSNCTS